MRRKSSSGRRIYVLGLSFGLLAPAGTSKAIVDQLHTTVVKILKMPDVREGLLARDMQPVGSSPEQFAALVKDELQKRGKVIKAAKVRVD